MLQEYTDMESLQNSLCSLSDLFHKRMANFEAELPKSQNTPSMVSLSSEFNMFKTFIIETLNNFQQQLDLINNTVDSMEMRSRRKMLLLHGIPEVSKEDTPEIISKTAQQYVQLPNFTNKDIVVPTEWAVPLQI